MDRYEALMNLVTKRKSVTWYRNINKLKNNVKLPLRSVKLMDDAKSVHLFYKKMLIEYYI